MTLDGSHALILAILVLYTGRYVNGAVPWLRRNSIPEPVTGGLIASITLTLIQVAAGITLTFDLTSRDLLLTVFFTTAGLSARVSMLQAGGVTLVVLTACAVVNLVLQDTIGVGLMTLLGLPPAAGLLAGSAALSGGHRTVLAWAPIIADRFDFPAGTALGAAAATLGPIAGGVLGGPLGERLIKRHRLDGSDAAALSVVMPYAQESQPRIDANGVLQCLLVIAICIAISGYFNDFLRSLGLTQVAVCWVLLSFVVFRLLGRSYDAAITTAGLFGLALGATPTAIAIMTAITKAHGASPRSFLVVPLVGAFFVDIAYAFVLQGFIQWLGGR